jgi:hypothetical protein
MFNIMANPILVSTGILVIDLARTQINFSLRYYLMNEEHLINNAERATQRIMAINWENSFDYARMASYQALVREYLRLSALWAKALNATEDWPFVNISAYLFPELPIVKPVIGKLELHLRENLGVNIRTTLTCLWYVRWSAIKEHEKVTIFNLDDPFEPLIRFYELGGYLRIENKFIDQLYLEIHNWQHYDSLEPFVDLNEVNRTFELEIG